MKKVLIGVIGVFILLAGISLASYPFISNYLMSLNHSSEIKQQEEVVERANPETIKKALDDAKVYNKNLLGSIILTDPFDPNFIPKVDVKYEELLNLNGDSVIATVEIPKIKVKMPIFHGTSQSVLLKGAGHLQNTSLPVGGKTTHAVITGHTGVSNASLFTDLDKLVKGDVFFIHVLNKTLAYEVDQIKVVLPTETDDLRIRKDKDYVTLLTCTPYGINSHRLLVRGERIPYEKAEEVVAQTETVESTWMYEYKRALLMGAIALVSVIAIFVVVRIVLSKRKKKKAEAKTD
ncbi:MAG: class C sortase [Ruminococcus sp.]|nr:class C sortase [Ruminococcus sp.]